MSEQLPGVPRAVVAALDELNVGLATAADSNLAGLIVYGGLARGRYRPGRSDVNVIVLLHDASEPALKAIAPALSVARRAAGVDPLLLTPAEIPRIAAAFPTKFLDIRNHHVVLAGADLFTHLEVTREQIRQRASQELHNILLRLRNRYVAGAADPVTQVRALTRIARPFALELAALLGLAGHETPADDRTAVIFEAAAAAFDFDRHVLARLASLRQEGSSDSDTAGLYRGVLEAVGRASDIANRNDGEEA